MNGAERNVGKPSLKSRWKASGMLQVPQPPPDITYLGVADYYLAAYSREFYRTRVVVKRNANIVTWTRAVSSGLLAVLGAASAASSTEAFPKWIGVVVAFVAAVATVISAWELHAQHRQHWVDKTVAMNKLTRTRIWLEGEKARGASENATAKHVLSTLSDVLEGDLDKWLRVHQAAVDAQKREQSRESD